MKISQKGPDPLKASRPTGGPASPTPSPAAGAARETAPLSSPSARVSTSRAEAGDAPVNAEQIARITRAIREGTFKVDAEAVADRLIALERDIAPSR